MPRRLRRVTGSQPQRGGNKGTEVWPWLSRPMLGVLLIAVGLKFQRCADPEIFVRISPWILTTDPRPRPQADAVSDPPSVRESRFLTRVYIRLTRRCGLLGCIYRGHNSKAMLSTAVNRKRQIQQRKYINNQQLFSKSNYKATWTFVPYTPS